MFSSRRTDGLYTRLYFAHIDENGNASKPFMLPQSNPEHNTIRMQSYNIPEFIKGEVPFSPVKLLRAARREAFQVEN